VREFQVRLLTETLIATRGNRSGAARILGIQRTYLLRLIREYKIDVPVRPRTHGSE
jgi:DNA-binding NtrC family response regulator